MSRSLRYIPPGGAVVEVTCKTLQDRFLLRPSRELRRRTIGILARAGRRHDVAVHGFVFLSNHYHMLLSVADAEQLAAFMGVVQSKLAREAGELNGWKGRFWASRYRAIIVSGEPEAQLERLVYLMSQGVKEGLVARAMEWPGASSVGAMIRNAELEGVWIDRSSGNRRLGRACRREPERLNLAVLPALAGSDPVQLASLIEQRLLLLEQETEINRGGRRPLGRRRVLRQSPFARPRRPVRRAIGTRFHCASAAVRQQLNEAYRAFVAAYRSASARLRAGIAPALFPEGCFPPRPAFVRSRPPILPGTRGHPQVLTRA